MVHCTKGACLHSPKQAGIILGLLFLAPTLAFAITPNFYQLSDGVTSIDYSTTSFSGQPQFTYMNGPTTLTFTGTDIRTVNTGIGTLVSVTIQQFPAQQFSVLIPSVSLKQGAGVSAPVETVGITSSRALASIPLLNAGQRTTYSVTPLTGSATFNLFIFKPPFGS